MLNEDLAAIFADTSLTVPVVIQSVTTTGFFNSQGEDLAGGIVDSTRFTLLIKVVDVPLEPKSGDSVTVDGIGYTVNGSHPVDDGKMFQVELSKT